MASIRVYPYLSPRLVEILPPDIEISIQELVNLIRDWEDGEEGQLFDFIISAAGKEQLGAGVTVGITATLNNAQIFFTPRSTPVDDGAGKTCDATDLNGEQLYVDDATFITDGVKRGDIVYNQSTGSSASVLEIVDENTIKHLKLSGGTSSQWTIGDNYIVFETEQCNVSGGNLVAVDDAQLEINPVFPSFGTQVVRTSSSSATLQELSNIQYSSFAGGVTVDVDNITGKAASGTTFPTGTPEQPSNNLTDAHTILDERGLNKIYVIGNLTLTNTNLWDRHEFIGESAIKSTITIPSPVSVNNCEFYECTITGSLDGDSQIERSVLSTISELDGYVFNCSLSLGSVTTLKAGRITNLLQCFSGQPGPSTPEINCNGTGILSVRDYVGGIKITNYTGASAHSLDIASGQVILDSATVLSGTFVVRGVGKLLDENGNEIQSGTWNGGVTIINELVTRSRLDETLAWSKKASDNAEQANLKL